MHILVYKYFELLQISFLCYPNKTIGEKNSIYSHCVLIEK